MALALEVQPHPADRAGPPISLLHKLTRNRHSKLTRLAQQPVVVPVIQAVAGAAGLFTDDGGARASSRVPVQEVQPLPTWTRPRWLSALVMAMMRTLECNVCWARQWH